MCEPTTIAIMTVGSALVSYEGQRQMAKQQKNMNARNYAAAVATHDRDQARLDRRQEEELVAYSQANFDVALDAKKARATEVVSQGESGISVGSISALDLVNDIDMQASSVLVRNEITQKNKLAALNDDRDKVYANMESRINNLPIVQNPSFLGTALEVGANLGTNFKYDSAGDLQFRT